MPTTKEWILSALGIDKCMESVGGGAGAQQGLDLGASTPRGGSNTEGSWLNSMFGMGKVEKTLDDHIKTLSEGGLFWRKMPSGKEPKTVWLALKLDDAPYTEATLEWRNPQLVLNMAVDKEGVPFDSIKEARAVQEGDDLFFPTDSISEQTNGVASSITIVSSKGTYVFEAANRGERDAWVEAFNACMVDLPPVLHANGQKKQQDAKRLKEIEERKASRDARRAEYAKAGMSNTARIMAQGTGRG